MEVKKMPPQMMNCISDPADLGIRRDAHVPTAAARVVLLLGGGMTCVYDRLDLSGVERCSNSWHRRSRPQWWGRPREFQWDGSRLDGCVDRVRLRSGSTAPAAAQVQPVVPMRYLPAPHTEHTARAHSTQGGESVRHCYLFNILWAGLGPALQVDTAGATDTSYNLVDADEGKAIEVGVSFTDDAGNAKTLTSPATATVGPKTKHPGRRTANHHRQGRHAVVSPDRDPVEAQCPNWNSPRLAGASAFVANARV